MASTHLTPMLEVIHDLLAKGDEVIDMMMLNATTPNELVNARLAESAIKAHAHVIRRLMESQIQLDEGITKIAQKVQELS